MAPHRTTHIITKQRSIGEIVAAVQTTNKTITTSLPIDNLIPFFIVKSRHHLSTISTKEVVTTMAARCTHQTHLDRTQRSILTISITNSSTTRSNIKSPSINNHSIRISTRDTKCLSKNMEVATILEVIVARISSATTAATTIRRSQETTSNNRPKIPQSSSSISSSNHLYHWPSASNKTSTTITVVIPVATTPITTIKIA